MGSLGELEVILVGHRWTLKCKGWVVPGEDTGKVGQESTPQKTSGSVREGQIHMISLLCGI